MELPEIFPASRKVELDSLKKDTAHDLEVYVRSQVKDRDDLRLGNRLLKGKYEDLEDKFIEALLRLGGGM